MEHTNAQSEEGYLPVEEYNHLRAIARENYEKGVIATCVMAVFMAIAGSWAIVSVISVLIHNKVITSPGETWATGITLGIVWLAVIIGVSLLLRPIVPPSQDDALPAGESSSL